MMIGYIFLAAYVVGIIAAFVSGHYLIGWLALAGFVVLAALLYGAINGNGTNPEHDEIVNILAGYDVRIQKNDWRYRRAPEEDWQKYVIALRKERDDFRQTIELDQYGLYRYKPGHKPNGGK